MNKPVLALTMGDVAGVGPEIIARTLLLQPQLRRLCTPIVIGDARAMRRGCAAAQLSPATINLITTPAAATARPDAIDLIQVGPDLGEVPFGEISPIAGDGAYRFVVEACRLARAGSVQGIVTAPLNKAAMHAGGHNWPGHTELLAHEFGVENFSMILASDSLYLFHLTTHQSLVSAVAACTPERTLRVIRLAAALARSLGDRDLPIALCGINPHAGEGGLFGSEEDTQLAPAIAAARNLGINAVGPLPADALIPQAIRGKKWKYVIACYHDQGHAPFKTAYGNDGVNITSGLPVVRVSVDHGTAFDIAGRGIAREDSLVLSCQRAAELSPGWAGVWHEAH